MRAIGVILAFVGVLWLLFAFNIDTSVDVGSSILGSGRVENLGLIAQRQNHLFVAGLLTLIGVLLIIFGGWSEAQNFNPNQLGNELISPKLPEPAAGERDLSFDSYRLWLAEKYAIERNEIFDRFVFDQKTFATLDDALAAAHALEVEALLEIEKAEKAQRIEAEEQQLIAEERALINEERLRKETAFFKKVGLGVVALLIVFLPLIVTKFREMATEAAVRREAEHKRIEVLFSESGIKPEESWINLRVSDVGNDNSTWCDSSEGRLFEFDTIETLAAVVASLTAQLGEGSDPYETLSVDISHMKRTWPATKRHGVVHLTAFGTGSYLCIGPNKKKK
jgi:hypothetical protein